MKSAANPVSPATDGLVPDRSVFGSLLGWSVASDTAAAFQWLIDIAGRTRTDPEQSRQLIQRQGTAARGWAKADPEGLSRWLVAHPSQPGYETRASALYHQLKETDPAAAASWGQAVTGPGMRQYIK